MTDIIDRAREAGVIGAGGAGFPTHVKLQARAEVLIANGAECEPLLEKDQHLVRRDGALLMKGLAAAAQATGAGRVVVATKAKYSETLEVLEGLTKGTGFELFRLKDFYPAGDEQVLVQEVLGRAVPPGGIPLDVGAVVSNVETLINLGAALEGNPVISKTLTITGAVARPATVRVPVGISAAEVIDFAGPKVSDYVVIDGGPVMGSVVPPEAPVTRKTGGLIVLPKDHPLALRNARPLDAILRQARSSCEQCQLCSEACPRRLLGHPLYPHLVMRAAGYASPDTKALLQTLICCGCRICDYVCPVGLSPSRVNWTFRAKLLAGGVRYPKSSSPTPHPMRTFRQVPSSRIRGWLGVEAFYGHTPWVDHQWRPKRVTISLAQATGAPAKPVVAAGQTVSAGDLIGEIPESKLGARVHASISGVVREVTQSAVIIEAGG